MSRVPGHRTSSSSIFLFLSLLLHFNLHVVSRTFVAGSEEATQRTLRATLLGDAVAEILPGVGRVSASSNSATFLVVADTGRRRLGPQGAVYEERTSERCTDVGAGWRYITTTAECEEGADVVRWSDVTTITLSRKKRPRGCYLDDNEYSLQFNLDTSSTDTCSSDFRCVCSLLCQPGTYQDQTGHTSCKTCSVGMYQNQAGQNGCKSCGTGKYNDQTQSTAEVDCKDDCNAGSYVASDKSACLVCKKGQWQNQDGQPNCNDCATGKYNDQTQSTEESDCNDCNAGSYLVGKSACLVCEKGQWQNQDGKSNCNHCATGKYNDQTQRTAESDCKDCGIGQYNDQTQQTNCQSCSPGSYSEILGSSTCTSCPDTQYGTKVGSSNSSDCVPCPLYSQCEGGKCKLGFDFNSECIACVPGEYYGSNCRKCPSAAVAFILDGMLVTVGLYMLFSLLYLTYHTHINPEDNSDTSVKDNQGNLDDSGDLKRTESTIAKSKRIRKVESSMCRILINQMQVLSAIFPSIRWSPNFPQGIIQFIQLMTTVFTIDFSGLFASPQCGAGATPRQNWVVRVMIPVALGMCLLFWSMFARCWHYYQSDANAQYSLGVMHRDGQGVDQSYERAAEYFEAAAKQGHAGAQFNLGALYKNGQGVEQSFDIAREWMMKAAEEGGKKNRSSTLLVILKIAVRLLLLGLYKTAIESCVRILICQKVDGVSKWIYDNKPCPISSSNDGFLAVFGIVMLILYGLTPYFYITIQLCRHGPPDEEDTTSSGYILYGWAAEGYKSYAYVWEPVNAIIIVLTVMAANVLQGVQQQIVQASIAGASLVLHAAVRPYEDPQGNFVVVLFTACELLSVLGAVENTPLQWAHVILLMMAFLVLLTVVVKTIVSEVRVQRQQFREGTASNKIQVGLSKCESYLLLPFVIVMSVPLFILLGLARIFVLAALALQCVRCNFFSVFFTPVPRLLLWIVYPFVYMSNRSIVKGIFISLGLHRFADKLEKNIWVDIQDMYDIAHTRILVRKFHPELRGMIIKMADHRWHAKLLHEDDEEVVKEKILKEDEDEDEENTKVRRRRSRRKECGDLLYYLPKVAESGDDIVIDIRVKYSHATITIHLLPKHRARIVYSNGKAKIVDYKVNEQHIMNASLKVATQALLKISLEPFRQEQEQEGAAEAKTMTKTGGDASATRALQIKPASIQRQPHNIKPPKQLGAGKAKIMTHTTDNDVSIQRQPRNNAQQRYIGSNWWEQLDPASRHLYYTNSVTGVTQWTWPNEVPKKVPKKVPTIKKKKQSRLRELTRKVFQQSHSRKMSTQVQQRAEIAAAIHHNKLLKRKHTSRQRLQQRLAKHYGTRIVPATRSVSQPQYIPIPKYETATSSNDTFSSSLLLRRAREHVAAEEVNAIRRRSNAARQESIIATLKKQQCADKNLQKRLALRHRAKQAQVLTKCKPFAKLSEEGQNEIVDQMSYEKILDETSLCKQGDVADRMYVLMSGHCAVVVDDIHVATLHPLDVFGESALFGTGGAGDKSSRRTATVTAREDLEVLVLTRENLQRLEALMPQCMDALKEVAEQRKIKNVLRKKAKEMDVLKSCTPFAKLTDQGRESVVHLLEYESFPTGTILCKQGEAADKMYLLMSGTCVVSVDGKKVGALSKLDVFGEGALFGERKRSATVVAKEQLQLLVLKRADMEKLIRSGDLDATCVSALETVSKKRQSSNVLALETVSQRVLKFKRKMGL